MPTTLAETIQQYGSRHNQLCFHELGTTDQQESYFQKGLQIAQQHISPEVINTPQHQTIAMLAALNFDPKLSPDPNDPGSASCQATGLSFREFVISCFVFWDIPISNIDEGEFWRIRQAIST